MAKEATNLLGTVDKAVDLLELLSSARQGMSLSDIARTLQRNVTTTHHILATLKARGFVFQDNETRIYRLGPKLLRLASRFVSEMDIYSVGVEPIRELRDRTGETAYLTVLYGDEPITIIEMLGVNPIQIRRRAQSGAARLHSTASGKALLAFLPWEHRNAILNTLTFEPFTPKTIATREQFETEIQVISQQGYALDREEDYVGVSCVAAPVFNDQGECIATASVSFPAAVMTRLEDLIQFVHATAAKISANLGYSGSALASASESGAVLAP